MLHYIYANTHICVYMQICKTYTYIILKKNSSRVIPCLVRGSRRLNYKKNQKENSSRTIPCYEFVYSWQQASELKKN